MTMRLDSILCIFVCCWITFAASKGAKLKRHQSYCEQFITNPQDANDFFAKGEIVRGYASPPLARLGNHLFMYASAFGIAHSNRFDLQHRPWPQDKEPNIFDMFNIAPVFTKQDEALPVLGEMKGTPLQFDPSCLHLAPNRYSLSGYRQSFKYFNNVEVEPKLRETLTFRNRSLEYVARSFLYQMNVTANKGDSRSLNQGHHRQIVGIHVRYGMTGHHAFGGCLPSSSYYLRAIEYFRKQYENVIFVYASEAEGMKWFKDQVLVEDPFNGYDIFPILTNDPVETFAILSHCDASVFSFGSFGWFVAWLANGPVIYSRHLARRPQNCEIVSRVGIRDFIPESWIGL